MQSTLSEQGAWTILQLSGRIDRTGADELAAVLAPLAGRQVALDLAGINYVTSAGLRVLLQAHKDQATAAGKLVLVAVTEPVRATFDIAGLGPLFAMLPDHAALDAFDL